MALPLLDVMTPRSIHAMGVAAQPKRMAWVYIPQGAYMPHWMPTTEGANFELMPCLEPMAEHRMEMLVFGGLTCDKGRANGDGGGDHARAGGAFLTGAQPKKTAGVNFQAGQSADQFAALRLGDKTRLPSLEIAIEAYRGAGDCDSGYSCAYSSNVSWRSENTPIPKEVNPPPFESTT